MSLANIRKQSGRRYAVVVVEGQHVVATYARLVSALLVACHYRQSGIVVVDTKTGRRHEATLIV